MAESIRAGAFFTYDAAAALRPEEPSVIEIARTDGLITVEQAAALCGVSPKTVHGWATHKRLRVAAREGRRLLFNLIDVAKVDHARGPNAPRAANRPTWAPGFDADTVLALALVSASDAPVPDPVVYYLQFAQRIKIGTTRYLIRRLRAIPHDRLLATEPGGTDVERERHREFAQFRIGGEWFSPAGPLMAHIASLKRHDPF